MHVQTFPSHWCLPSLSTEQVASHFRHLHMGYMEGNYLPDQTSLYPRMHTCTCAIADNSGRDVVQLKHEIG